jgi:hypothetical protein
MLDAPDFQKTVVLNSTPSNVMPGPDAPDWQETVQVVPSAQTDAPDWQVVAVGPGGGSPCPPSTAFVVQFAYGVSSDNVNVSVVLGTTPKLGNLLVMGFNQYTSRSPMSAPAGWTLIAAGDGFNQAFYGRIVQPGDGISWGPFSESGLLAFSGPVAGIWEIGYANGYPYGDKNFGFSVSSAYSWSTALTGISIINDLPLVMALNANTTPYDMTDPGPTTLTRSDPGTITKDVDVLGVATTPGVYEARFAFGHGSYVAPLSTATFTESVDPDAIPSGQSEIGVVLIHSV